MNQKHGDQRVQSPYRRNLPVGLTSFIGRKREIEEIARLLPSASLLSLIGAGGCGKTRLALRIAAELDSAYADGVCWVELARLTDPALVPQAVLKALNLTEQSGTTLMDTLLESLRSRQVLLVLDNCEHLLDACAQLVETLLSYARANILVTSREPLGIHGEALYPVMPLALPAPSLTPAEMERVDAVQLFIARARSIRPDFALTAENAEIVAAICRHLDGIPLAIELASARVSVLSVEQIYERLDHRFDLLVSATRTYQRHRTLRAAIDWSYDLLATSEQCLLQRLTVFPAGFSLSAAEAACAWGVIRQPDVLDLLASLVSKSLVVAETLRGGEARYHLLETIRQYAQEKLTASGEWVLAHDQYLACYLRIAEDIAPKSRGQYQQLWLNWLEIEHDNLRAALAWALEQHIEMGLRIAIALYPFWDIRGYDHEAFTWFERLLAHADNTLSLAVHVNALTNASFFATFLGDALTSTIWGQTAVDRCYAAGEEGKPLLGFALAGLGSAAQAAGDVQTTYTIAQRILELERSSGDNFKIGMVLFIRGMSAITLGKYAAAHQHLDEALLFARKAGDPYRRAIILNSMGDLARCEQRFDLARSFYEESLSIFRDLSDAPDHANTVRNLAYACLRLSDVERAHALFRESLEANRALDDNQAIVHSLLGFAALAAAVGLADESARLMGWATADRSIRVNIPLLSV